MAKQTWQHSLLIIVALMLAGCAAQAPSDAASLQVMEASPQIGQASPTMAPTLTATPAGTPTADYQAQIGQAQLQLQLQLGTATMAAVTAESIQATQSRLDAQAAATSTATAAVAQTQEAHTRQTQQAAQTATVQAPITHSDSVRSDWEPAWQALLWSGTLLLFLVALWYTAQIGNQLLKLAYEKRLALHETRTPTAAPEPAKAVTVTLDTRDGYGWGSVDFATLPIDRLTFQMVAELILQGCRYTQAQMTGAGKPLVKDGNYDTFGDWMAKNKIAIRMDDGRYVIQHREFFEKVLSA